MPRTFYQRIVCMCDDWWLRILSMNFSYHTKRYRHNFVVEVSERNNTNNINVDNNESNCIYFDSMLVIFVDSKVQNQIID